MSDVITWQSVYERATTAFDAAVPDAMLLMFNKANSRQTPVVFAESADVIARRAVESLDQRDLFFILRETFGLWLSQSLTSREPFGFSHTTKRGETSNEAWLRNHFYAWLHRDLLTHAKERLSSLTGEAIER